MKAWQKDLSKFLTGEAFVADASTWYLQHKDFSQSTGYNILGQYQGDDPNGGYYIWVGVTAPDSYGISEAKGEVLRIVAAHSDYFGLIAVKSYDHNFKSGVLFATSSDPDGKMAKITALAPSAGGGGDDDLTKIIIVAVVAVLLIAIVYVINKRI